MKAFAKIATDTNIAPSLVDAIYDECPELTGKICRPALAGEKANVIIFPKTVSKGPKNPNLLGEFDREWKIMKMLREAGITEVPAVQYVGEKAHFFNQERQDGEVLIQHHLNAFSEDEKKKLAEQIATFMDKLAKTGTPEKLSTIGIQTDRWRPEQILGTLLDPRIKEFIGKDREWMHSAVSDYCQQLSHKPLVFLHADMNWSNILVSPQEKRIAAIIDYGDCHYAPAELGFQMLYGSYNSEFVDKIAQSYADITGQKPITHRDSLVCMLTHRVRELGEFLDGTDEHAVNQRDRYSKIFEYLEKMFDKIEPHRSISISPQSINPNS